MATLADRLHGVIPPVLTPWKTDGSFDESSARRIYQHMLDINVNGLFLFGTSGEGVYVQEDERPAIIETAKQVVGEQVPLLVGTIAPGTEVVIRQAEEAKALGADAIVVCAPFYYGMDPEGILRHFRTIRSAVDIPIFVYDIPQTTNCKIPYQCMLELAKEGTIIGLKDSSPDVSGFRRLVVNKPDGFKMFTGSELLFDAILMAGAHGIVPGMGNVAPELFVQIYENWNSGDHEEVLRIQEKVVQVFEVFCGSSGVPDMYTAINAMKTTAMLRGWIDSNTIRNPFPQPDENFVAQVKSQLEELELL